MSINWIEIRKKAIEKQEEARKASNFMFRNEVSYELMATLAMVYPEEVKNLFRSNRLVHYIEKRIARQ